MSKIIIHATGGGGINIANKCHDALTEIGEGFATLEYKWLDTSIANSNKVVNGELQTISSNKLTEDDLAGSGGMRSSNSDDIIIGIKEYLDANNFIMPKKEEFHIVIFSGGGGSGSVLGPMVIKELLSKDFTVVGIMVGDTKDSLSSKNTFKTFQTLGSIVKMTNSRLSLFYRNNNNNPGSENERLSETDNEILGFITSLTLFLSGENEGIDTQDMINFIDQKKYKGTLDIPMGIYFLEAVSGTIVENHDCTIINTRTLLSNVNDKSPLLTQTLHDKTGIILKKEVFNVIDTTGLPITLTSTNGCLNKQISDVKNRIEHLKSIEDNLHVDIFEDSEDGLIF